MTCNCNCNGTGKCKSGAADRRGDGGGGRQQFLALPWRLRRAVRHGRLTLDEASALRASGAGYARSMLREMDETDETWPGLEGETPKPAKSVDPKRWPCESPIGCVTLSKVAPRVTPGEFGTELLWYTDAQCMSARVTTLLATSATFMTMARVLDEHYVAFHGRASCKQPGQQASVIKSWEAAGKPNEDGVVTTGNRKGTRRRMLRILVSRFGSNFFPAHSTGPNQAADELWFELLGDDTTPQGAAGYIAIIAHETTHAFHHVRRGGAAPKTVVARVCASLQEEIETRENVRKILREIDAKGGRKFLKEVAGTSDPKRIAEEVANISGSTERKDVERNPFPGEMKRTYLEEFVLGYLTLAAIDKEKLTQSEIADLDQKVDAVPLPPKSLDSYLARPFPMWVDPPQSAPKDWTPPRGIEYANFRLYRRVIDARWRRFEASAPTDRGWREKAAEAVRQQHARAFFRKVIDYTPLSGAATAGPAIDPCAPARKPAPPATKGAPARRSARELGPIAWAAESELPVPPRPRPTGGVGRGARGGLRPLERRSPPTRIGAGAPAPAASRKHKPLSTAEKTAKLVAARWPCETAPSHCYTTVSVSSGEFGRELLHYSDASCVPRVVTERLKKSPTFVSMVCDLDAIYVGYESKAVCRPVTMGPTFSYNTPMDVLEPRDGRATAQPFAGKRIIVVSENRDGSSFEPAGSLPNNHWFDFIHIQSPVPPGDTPSRRHIAEWVARIAHECTHAWRLATWQGARTSGVANGVAAAIREEVLTRATEAAILGEIDRATKGSFLKGITNLTGSTDPARVERDFFPGATRRTYLEEFVLGQLMLDAIERQKKQAEANKKAKLTDTELAAITESLGRIDKEVDAIPLPADTLDTHLTNPSPKWFDSSRRVFRDIPTDYGTFRFFLRVVDARWKRLESTSGPGGPSEAAKEKMRQEHAKAFFRTVAAYTAISARPAPAPTPARGTSRCWPSAAKAPAGR